MISEETSRQLVGKCYIIQNREQGVIGRNDSVNYELQIGAGFSIKDTEETSGGNKLIKQATMINIKL